MIKLFNKDVGEITEKNHENIYYWIVSSDNSFDGFFGMHCNFDAEVLKEDLFDDISEEEKEMIEKLNENNTSFDVLWVRV